MIVHINGQTVLVSGVRNLDKNDAARLRDELEIAMARRCRQVDVDLSQTKSVDSVGLGVLLRAWMDCGRVRLLNAPDLVRQFLDLTRQRRRFEFVQI